MSSSNGTEYYLKSMNGIKSFDDGSGTIIEDDSITIATIVNALEILILKALRRLLWNARGTLLAMIILLHQVLRRQPLEIQCQKCQ